MFRIIRKRRCSHDERNLLRKSSHFLLRCSWLCWMLQRCRPKEVSLRRMVYALLISVEAKDDADPSEVSSEEITNFP